MNDGPNDKAPIGKTTTEILNEQAAEIAKLRSEKAEWDQHKQRLVDLDRNHGRLVELCETADPEQLVTRAQDLHRIAFLIHHAQRIVIGEGESAVTMEGDGVLIALRANLDALRGTRRDVRPLRTVRTTG